MGDAERLQGAAGRQYVLVREAHGEAVEAPEHHHLDDAEIQLQLDVLGHVAKLLAPPGLRHLAGTLVPEADVATVRGQLAEEGAHQGGLAGPVRADDHMDLTRMQSEAEIPQQGLLAEGEESRDISSTFTPPAEDQPDEEGHANERGDDADGEEGPGMMDLESTEAAESMQARTGRRGDQKALIFPTSMRAIWGPPGRRSRSRRRSWWRWR